MIKKISLPLALRFAAAKLRQQPQLLGTVFLSLFGLRLLSLIIYFAVNYSLPTMHEFVSCIIWGVPKNNSLAHLAYWLFEVSALGLYIIGFGKIMTELYDTGTSSYKTLWQHSGRWLTGFSATLIFMLIVGFLSFLDMMLPSPMHIINLFCAGLGVSFLLFYPYLLADNKTMGAIKSLGTSVSLGQHNRLRIFLYAVCATGLYMHLPLIREVILVVGGLIEVHLYRQLIKNKMIF